MSVLAVPAGHFLFPLQTPTAAAGSDATMLGKRRLDVALKYPARQRLLDELQMFLAPEEAADWHGNSANPTSADSWIAAVQFLSVLPPSFLDLEVSPEIDGCISFDWYRNKDRQLSISFAGDGCIHYAAILGPVERVSGRLAFHDSVPEEIIRLLRRIG
jgi:hypothetical protein